MQGRPRRGMGGQVRSAGGVDMSEHLLIVEAAVDEQVEAEWNRWYDEQHLPEIERCPGIADGRRFVTETAQGRRYVTIYSLDSPAALETPEFSERRGWAQFQDHVRATVRVYTSVQG